VLERDDEGAEVIDLHQTKAPLKDVILRIRNELDKAKYLENNDFHIYESINLRVLEQGNWREYTRQPRTCHMQAFRQVLTPMGLFNCPAHRGVPKARISGKLAYRDAASATQTKNALGEILDRFDASFECREVTCLYNGVNWWLENLVQNTSKDIEAEIGDDLPDYFL